MSHKNFLGLPRIDIVNIDDRMDKFNQFCDEVGLSQETAIGLPTEQLRALGFIDCHLPRRAPRQDDVRSEAVGHHPRCWLLGQ